MSNLQKIHELLPDNTEQEISEKDMRDTFSFVYEDMEDKLSKPSWNGYEQVFFVTSSESSIHLRPITLSPNYIGYWTGNTFYNSLISQVNNNIGIGNNNPQAKLDVFGTIQGTALFLPINNDEASAYRFRSDGTNLFYADGNSVEKRLATFVDLTTKLDKISTSAQTVASAVTFSGNVSTPKLILQVQSANTTVGAIWSDGTWVYYNGSSGTPKKLAYDENGVNISVIHLNATSINISTATDSNGLRMHGKSVIHENTSNATITVVALNDFICKGIKVNTGNITFVAGNDITIIQADATLTVNGNKGSSYVLERLTATEYLLSIKNI